MGSLGSEYAGIGLESVTVTEYSYTQHVGSPSAELLRTSPLSCVAIRISFKLKL